MRNTFFILTALFLITINASAQDAAAPPDPHVAGPSRADLVIPDEIWSDVLHKTGFGDGPLGYSADTMAHFKGSQHVLGTVERLFRDITRTPRLAGLVGDQLLDKPSDFANAAAIGFSILDAYGGRHVEPPGPDSWGVEWLDDGATLDTALDTILFRSREVGFNTPMSISDREQWNMLPDGAKRLVLRILVAAVEFTPYLNQAIDENFYLDYFHVRTLADIPMFDLYTFASAPWSDEEEDEYSLTPRESFEALDRFDMNFHATGAKGFLTHARAAIDEWKAAIEGNGAASAPPAGFTYCEFLTPVGLVGIFGTDADTVEGSYSFVFNLGGDDTYSGATAVPRSLAVPIGVVVDLGGDDVYDPGEQPAALACGNHGVGAIFDLAGDDIYRSHDSGIGCAWYGTGAVVDYEGDDVYESRTRSQGAARVGVGMLIDLEGDDNYRCDTESQAFGGTLGVGLLVDASGDDVYFADPEGAISELFEGRTCNLSQGFGYGRRADFGDGHSLGGGVGFLAEGGGDDSYTGSVYTQGAGYWWALGCLEDRGGDDVYMNEQYSCGSAPHFAIGCCVDLSGDDKYNVGNDDMERQLQAHARDGSFGIFIDGAGDDEYQLDNLCAGSSDLNSLTLFWDRMGDDTYIADRRTPRNDANSFGGVTFYEPFHTFRDETPSVGIFLDTGGTDSYSNLLPDDASSLIPLQFGDSSEWWHDDLAMFKGYGRDEGWY